jgi:hypothetical protein
MPAEMGRGSDQGQIGAGGDMMQRVSKIRNERRLTIFLAKPGQKKVCALTERSARNGDRRRAAAQDGVREDLKPGTMAEMALG